MKSEDTRKRKSITFVAPARRSLAKQLVSRSATSEHASISELIMPRDNYVIVNNREIETRDGVRNRDVAGTAFIVVRFIIDGKCNARGRRVVSDERQAINACASQSANRPIKHEGA